jgi:mono/diheme cytochrome c family protein
MKYVSFGLLFASLPLLAQAPASTTEQKEYFENKIRPLLAQNCFACHTNSQMGGLRLDSREGLLKGGKSGPAVVPGDADKSLLITAVRQTTDLKMPRYGHLTDEQIQNLTAWVKDGAVWPADEPVKTAQGEGYVIRPEVRRFWSFQPVQKPAAPKVKDAAWPANDQVGLEFTDGAGEFESMSRARTGDQHLSMLGVEVDDEIVIRRVCENADAGLAHRGLGELWQHRTQRDA